jgi:flagellar P-ring protein precursor FlgI
MEREISTGLPQNAETMELVLDRADFTNSKRVTEAINKSFGSAIALPVDSRSVRLNVPAEYRQKPVDFIAAIEAVSVDIDSKARVVVNERTGTVIIGSDVTISSVSIAHGNLSIQIQTDFQVSQPQPFSSGGSTAVIPEQKVNAQEQKSNFVTLGRGATVDDLIRALNALGVTPRDTIAILEALKTAGALQAELEIM